MFLALKFSSLVWLTSFGITCDTTNTNEYLSLRALFQRCKSHETCYVKLTVTSWIPLISSFSSIALVSPIWSGWFGGCHGGCGGWFCCGWWIRRRGVATFWITRTAIFCFWVKYGVRGTIDNHFIIK
jgi:hypothetical protein